MIVLLFAVGFVYVLYAIWLLSMIVCWQQADRVPQPCNDASHLTLIIPFRNEAEHLPALLSALSKQKKDVPGVKIILVDDHSTDDSLHAANLFSENNQSVEVLSQKETHGKKLGVDMAMSRVITEWVVTLDADIQPCEGWLRRIASWTKDNSNDLLILPLHIGPGTNFIGRIQEVEFASVMAITGGMAMAGQPILCNGGNLCFRTEAYKRVRTTRSDMHITSGDDVFLLNALKPMGKVVWVHDPHVRVSTAPKKNWKDFTSQRLRWMGKAGFIRDPWLQSTAWLTFLTNAFLAILFCMTAAGVLPIYLLAIVAGIKIMLDGWLILRVGNWLCIKQLKRFYLALVFLYPFYATLFPLMSQFVKPTWKGRTTNNR
jgi:biofilm PGA synthesis N-glycosyltransferase PgaC